MILNNLYHQSAVYLLLEAAEECPTICNAIYAPLCGSDGQTHSNECQMKTKACTKATVIFKVHNGECGKIKIR